MPGASGRRERVARLAAVVLAITVGGCGWAWMERGPDTGEREETAPSVGTVRLKPAPAPGDTRPAGTPVADPFRPGERVADWGGTRVHAGGADRSAYVYGPDYASALVAGGPGHNLSELAFERGDWHIACGADARPFRCRLRVLARVAPGGRAEAALRIRTLAGEPGPVVCAGALDATGPAIRTGEGAPWRYGGGDGCFGRDDSARILAELARSPAFAYAYTGGDGTPVSGSRATFGLAVGLELMAWMDARRGVADGAR